MCVSSIYLHFGCGRKINCETIYEKWLQADRTNKVEKRKKTREEETEQMHVVRWKTLGEKLTTQRLLSRTTNIRTHSQGKDDEETFAHTHHETIWNYFLLLFFISRKYNLFALKYTLRYFALCILFAFSLRCFVFFFRILLAYLEVVVMVWWVWPMWMLHTRYL